jgi:hypothetical protein
MGAEPAGQLAYPLDRGVSALADDISRPEPASQGNAVGVSERRIAFSKPLHHAASRMSQLRKSSSAAMHERIRILCLDVRRGRGGDRGYDPIGVLPSAPLGTISVCRIGLAAGTSRVSTPSSLRTILQPWAIAVAL